MDNFNSEMIKYHNTIRNDLYDTDQYNLVYDNQLATNAQGWANYLSKNECYNSKGEHPSDERYTNRNELCKKYLGAPCDDNCKETSDGNYMCPKNGQNVSTLTIPDNVNYEMKPEIIVNGWYNEIFEHDTNNHHCDDVLYNCGALMTDTNKECGHASQVLWKNSKKIGCGYSTCKHDNSDRYFIVCNYDQGNITNNLYCGVNNDNSTMMDNLPSRCHPNRKENCTKYNLDEAIQL